MNDFIGLIDTAPSWLNILYVLILLFFAMPIVLKKLNETIGEYRKLFLFRRAKVDSPELGEAVTEINRKILEIEEKIRSLNVDDVTREISELKKLISNNPKEILTVQKLSIEFDLIKAELASIKGNSKWLIGTIVTLSLGVAAIIVSVLLSGSSNG